MWEKYTWFPQKYLRPKPSVRRSTETYIYLHKYASLWIIYVPCVVDVDPLEDTLDSTNSLGSIITFSGGMNNSSTDVEGNQPNTQRGSEYSSGIDTASSGQLESASFTSEILLANRVNSSAGSRCFSFSRVKVSCLSFAGDRHRSTYL